MCKKGVSSPHLKVEDLEAGKQTLIKLIQTREFKTILEGKQNSLGQLNPFQDKDGILRVGGRLASTSLDLQVKHPIILPKSTKMVEVIIRWCHEKVGHAGRGITQNEIRNHGFWTVNGNSTVRWCISRCVTCRKLRGKHGQQKMGDLPNDRTNEAPPFTYCGLDMFGPFYIKQKRSTLNHYGIIFTCLVSRAVHLESAGY